jgi:hypothetical protein
MWWRPELWPPPHCHCVASQRRSSSRRPAKGSANAEPIGKRCAIQAKRRMRVPAASVGGNRTEELGKVTPEPMALHGDFPESSKSLADSWCTPLHQIMPAPSWTIFCTFPWNRISLFEFQTHRWLCEVTCQIIVTGNFEPVRKGFFLQPCRC